MLLYNTLTKKREEFVPITPGRVTMYVCGPTVYDFIHIGNARPMIVFDSLRRYFEHKGFEVNYVSNFTDVDDKIIRKSVEEGIPAQEVAERYIKECRQDMEHMNVKPATVHPRATEAIPGMIEMIQTLIDKGYAYEKNGTVYYRTRLFKEYGKLSHKNLDDLRSGFRDLKVSGEDEKEDPLDFVLWKPKKEGEPFWESPWSEGRPGWHIECSVMAKRFLGDTIDIHAGGEDLIFPHHENEIAQSEACNGVPFAHYWLHNAFLNIDNRKMSKSLGNFFTVREIEKTYNLQVLRLFMLSAHYRSPLNFSHELMESAKSAYERICNCVDNLNFLAGSAADGEMSGAEKELAAKNAEFTVRFDQSMEDDVNTADALSVIFDLVKFANSEVSGENSRAFVLAVKKQITDLGDILGLIFEQKREVLDSEIEELIAQRQAARREKDFKRADEIRGRLADMGITLLDTREGVKWKRA